MKFTFKYTVALSVLLAFSTASCKDFLEEEVYTQYDPNSFLKDKAGVDALLTGAYARARIVAYDSRNYTFLMNEFTTDIAFETGGGLERDALPFIQFSWGANNSFLNSFWVKMYAAIGSANTVLQITQDLEGIPQENITQIEAEARFIRAVSYYYLYNLFGSTPLIEIPQGATPDEIEQIGKATPRATREDFISYLTADLEFAYQYLPVEENPIGRATKGSALAVLTKLFLHEKEWAKVAETSQLLMELNYYALYPDYKNLFSVAGENNKEFIYRAPCLPISGYHNNYMAHAFPPNYPIQSNWANFGAQFRTYTSFYKTFENQDLRRGVFVTSYTDNSGSRVELLEDQQGNPLNNVRSFKYVPDPAAVGEAMGNDIVYIRYADILLSRAEALNELNGPNQESVDLLNQVRARANVDTKTVGDFKTTESFRNFILEERGREFFTEGLRREDLIRHGKFISGAQSRGYPAQDYHVVFPIPQQQIDANPTLKQNQGY